MQDAANFNVITAHVIAYEGQVPAMKVVNPNLRVLAYMNATFSQAYQGTTYPIQDYAVDAQGHRVTASKSGNFLMDPSNTDWINNRINQCEIDVEESGYDGCYLDLLGGAPVGSGFVTAPPINQSTHQPWTRSQWLTATANLAASMQAAVHSITVYGHPVLVYGNGLVNGAQYYDPVAPSSMLIGSLDGGVAESWLRQQGDSVTKTVTASVWLENVNMIAAVEAMGKPLLIITKLWVPATQAQQDAWREFALASYLMGTQGLSMFFFSAGWQIPRTTFLPWYNTTLGAASGPYSFQSSMGVYERTFANGLVLVNVDSVPHTVTLGQTYYTLGRQAITSATMAPSSGLVLTTS
jgi:hypothetical protein